MVELVERELRELTADDFSPYLGEIFESVFTDGVILFELGEVIARGPSPQPGLRASFSLIFLGPVDLMFPQQIYPLEHPAFGFCEIFLVPIGTEGGRGRYQALFN